MRDELALDYEEKMNLTMMLDLLIIYKLIETWTEKSVPDDSLFYLYLRSDYVSYDDAWYGLESFLALSGIGELDCEAECCAITIYSVRDLYRNMADFCLSKQIEIKETIQQFINALITENQSSSLFHLDFDEEELRFKGYAEFADICWHGYCEQLLKIHNWSKATLEGLREHD